MTYIALLLFVAAYAKAQPPTIILEDGKVWVKNLNEEVLYTFNRYFHTQQDWENVFPVSLAESSNGIAIAGNYEVASGSVSFTPRFPFAINIDYSARFFTDQLAQNPNEVYLPSMKADVLELNFRMSLSKNEQPAVMAIYPTSESVPENLLKFHISFSKSMTRGEVYSRVKLLDENGKIIERPFLIVDEEFWDDEMKTVTLLFDPGRVKRGLRPNLEMKPALSQNNKYTLVIEEGWKDIDGLSTPDRTVKSFYCTAADRSSPEVKNFQVIAPASNLAPLAIDFKEPLNSISLSRAIQIVDQNGQTIAGSIEIKNAETMILFVPKNPWSDSRYSILFNSLTEDLAGNNLNRLFDNDLAMPASAQPKNLSLDFYVSRELR
jgi:hypothetical protein